MKKTLKTDDAYIEISKNENNVVILNIYNNYDKDMFVETFLSVRELKAISDLLEEFLKNDK